METEENALIHNKKIEDGYGKFKIIGKVSGFDYPDFDEDFHAPGSYISWKKIGDWNRKWNHEKARIFTGTYYETRYLAKILKKKWNVRSVLSWNVR